MRWWPVWRTSDHIRDPRDNRLVGGHARGRGLSLDYHHPHRVLWPSDITGQIYHGDSLVSKSRKDTFRAPLKCQMQIHTHACVACRICDVLLCVYIESFCLLFKDLLFYFLLNVHDCFTCTSVAVPHGSTVPEDIGSSVTRWLLDTEHAL